MPKRKHEPSQAQSLYDLCVLTVDSQENPAPLSIPSPVQEQEVPARVKTFPDVYSFSDYILHNTDWIHFLSRCKTIREDKGLSHIGGANFIRTNAYEEALAESIKNAEYIDGVCDMSVCEDRIEDKFISEFKSKTREEIEIMVKKTRGSANKKDKELQRTDPEAYEEQERKKAQKKFDDWMKEDRYDYMIIFHYNSFRMFVTTSDFVKQNAYLKREGIASTFTTADIHEVQWQHIVGVFPELYENRIPYSEFIKQAKIAFKNQYPIDTSIFSAHNGSHTHLNSHSVSYERNHNLQMELIFPSES